MQKSEPTGNVGPRRPPNWLFGAVLAVAVLFFLTVPFQFSGYWVRFFTGVFMFAIMAQATDLITGWAGYPALGNIVFFGLGAYSVGVLMKTWGVGFFPALALAGLFCAWIAFVVGLPVLRTKGHYFVMATLGINEVAREVVIHLDLTGGGKGLVLPTPALGPPALYTYFYFIMFVILVLCVLTTYGISKHPIGYGLRAIRADEEAACVMGVNATLLKSFAWSVSAFFTGLAGGTFAYWQTFIEPAVVFDVLLAVQVFVMILLGGMGTIFGPVLGAFIVEHLGEIVWGNFPEYHLGILGIGIVLIVLLLPAGVMDFVKRLETRWMTWKSTADLTTGD